MWNLETIVRKLSQTSFNKPLTKLLLELKILLVSKMGIKLLKT
jgi:hypothetical protein